MFASKSERKVHYSIRKFSIGVASVVVASLVMGSVVHATEKEGATQVPLLLIGQMKVRQNKENNLKNSIQNEIRQGKRSRNM